MEEWELSDEDFDRAFEECEGRYYTDVVAQVAAKKLVEVIKEDTVDNAFSISDELWKSLCKKLGVK